MVSSDESVFKGSAIPYTSGCTAGRRTERAENVVCLKTPSSSVLRDWRDCWISSSDCFLNEADIDEQTGRIKAGKGEVKDCRVQYQAQAETLPSVSSP